VFSPSPDLLGNQEPAGTFPYTAPEQLRGKPCFASDQYSLGIIAYEWLCGKRPFEGNAWEIMHQHLYTAPPPLRDYCPTLPAAVETVILRALAKDPGERFVSMQAFAQALARVSQ
jgi:serine/threonine protein kinase